MDVTAYLEGKGKESTIWSILQVLTFLCYQVFWNGLLMGGGEIGKVEAINRELMQASSG